ncbi:ABC-type xenobiotic transporter [Ranunculus cassubicifolius]
MAEDKYFDKADDEKDTEKAKGRHGRENSFPLYRLFSFPDRADMVLMSVGGIAAFLNGLTIPLITLIFGQLVDTFGGTARNDIVEEVSKVALKFVYLGIASALATCVQMSCWMITGERQSERIRNMYLKAVLRQDITFFDRETNMGEVVGKMSGDIVLIQDAMGEKVGKSIQLMSSFTGGFVVAFSRGWLLVLVMMSTVPLLIFSGATMSMAVTLMATREQEAYSRAASLVEQTIGSIKTVASFTGEREAINQYNKFLIRSYKSSVQEGLAAGLGMGMVLFVIFCSYGLAVWSGSRFIIERGYTGGEVVNVVIAIVTSSMSLGEASPCVKAFAAGKAAAFNMFETIERKPDIDSSDTGGLKLEDIHGDIELKDICFRYPTRPHEQIFDGLSLSIPSGHTVALVGESGSGKSTVISLIQRFYDPQAGEILIDSINLKEYQLRWIREKMGLVGQEPVLFASTIKDNIAYGKDNSTIKEIKAAAELANAATFIDKLPQGLETMVGDNGTQLSGGQKQRVAIARAILRNPRILLLDEATSALDTESERSVQEALDRIMTSRTTIVVAHRLSTVKNSHMIAVVCNGKIVEKGPHSELVKLSGTYSQLISLQEEKKATSNYHDKPVCTLGSPRRLPHCVSLKEPSGVQYSSSTLHLPAVVKVDEIEPAELTDGQTPQQSKDVPLRRLINLNRPEFPMLILGCVFAVINGSVLPVFGLLFSNMIEKFYEMPDKLRKDSTFYMKMFVALGFVSLIASTARSYFFAVAGSQLIRRVRSMSFEKVLHMEIGWFDSTLNSSSAIGSKLSMDAATVRGLVGDTLALIVQNFSSLLLGVAIALLANWQLALVVVALVPLLVFNTWAYMKFMQGFSADAKVMYGEASKVANDAVRNIRTVASFSAEEKVMDLYRKRCKTPKEAGIKLGLITGGAFGLSFFFLLCSYAISFYVGARLVQDGKAEFVQVFRVFFALCMAAMAVSMASTITPDTTKAKACTASVFEILDGKSKIDSSTNTGTTLENVKGDIEFQCVSFTYPMRPTAQILQEFDLTIESGKMVALVGESGCGKSTVISLLQRFYNPNSGQILLDGTEIQKFQVRWLRQQMGLVSQEPSLFNDTIRANIAYGKEGETTEAEILAAAEAANAHKFISAMEKGYDTLVGERGVQLSGGQKQRVAIARAMVKAPKILLLDEATSALDAESERVVQIALDQVMIDRTTIVVAHRLSTIKGANMIAVIKNGAVVEKGRHAELVKIKDGCYASLSAVHIGVS